ncbi:MAG: glycoside hydrolase family 65 protein, partial [Bacteroidota bacterium]|nr:glycoside hydrolase family 65 protein [Bacteroidota bacterium]MDX5429471.1 glycoside hydrolase family 65 protein [Bacteroidota bacterium]MDX5468260.1 glycoside hydrolase family 65 protein [Bacteroidota bacterium]
MKKIVEHDEWKLICRQFDPTLHMARESLFSLGNGHMGQRANFEEDYSGKSLSGTYVGGIYYPDKTRVGWWKIGYPEYFAKVLNSPSWMRLSVHFEGQRIDLAKLQTEDFYQELDMQNSVLRRHCTIKLQGGFTLAIEAERFLHAEQQEAGLLRYQVRVLQGEGELDLLSFIEGDVRNHDANYEEDFWEEVSTGVRNSIPFLQVRTRKTHFDVAYATEHRILLNGKAPEVLSESFKGNRSSGIRWKIWMKQGDTVSLEIFAVISSSLNHDKNHLINHVLDATKQLKEQGYDALLSAHCAYWKKKWEHSDIRIDGDIAAQQGIRFNILQLNHTYFGNDPRLNIGPKGFTGEKYGGSTYWDTEAYCIPFYLATSPEQVARQLLEYRYKQLPQAIANAQKLGFKNGAALYPMVTMNGEECHNEWEITFEEIHRNGAIAYAIYNFINYTGKSDYLYEGGLEVLIGIARFWSQRFTWSEDKKAWVMLGVTGPNEYENNVNNNWYTNYIAAWCMSYTRDMLIKGLAERPAETRQVLNRTGIQEQEWNQWRLQVEKVYYPVSEQHGVFLQQEGYLDKEQLTTDQLNPAERPLNQHWSWDRILRSCFIKQADVLQGLYFFEDDFDLDTLKRNFDFYEPRTVHESSLSPCVHSILAARLGYAEKAYEMYLRTSRLDLDDYNAEVHEGLHITSMAGTWMSLVQGFGGMRVKEGVPEFEPMLPQQWAAFSFTIGFRDRLIRVEI